MTGEAHLVLHGAAVRKHASAAAIADLIGGAVDAVEATLAVAVARGRASVVNDKYLLTPAGRMIVEAQYSRHYADARADQALLAAHGRFESINAELKGLITDWQTLVVGGQRVANDHSNSAYDETVIDRVAALHEKLEPVLKVFTSVVPRFRRYAGRLEAALQRVEAGEHAWVSDATRDSYHTVWFELHEDILRVLGRDRVE